MIRPDCSVGFPGVTVLFYLLDLMHFKMSHIEIAIMPTIKIAPLAPITMRIRGEAVSRDELELVSSV